MVLVCKHHDGFCNWQTATTDYSVKSSSWRNGKGDTVREFVEACRSANMRFGLYLSPWDRHEPKYKDKDAYDKFYISQLEELLRIMRNMMKSLNYGLMALEVREENMIGLRLWRS